MEIGFSYTFPAIRGIQGKREYYVVMCPLKLIPKIFLFNEEEIPPEFRAQRVINKARVPEIAEYILDNPNDYAFSSLTASIDGEMQFTPFSEANAFSNIGNLSVSMEARFLINDGQHRRSAIEEAIKASPELGNETISVVFYKDSGLKRSQQIFADLNRHAVNTTKSIGILYDSRDELANLSKEIVYSIDMLRSLTDLETSSLSKFSPKIFTLSNVHSTNCKLLGKKKGDKISPEERQFIFEVWDSLCSVIKEWIDVKNKKLSAHTLRNNFINSHGIVLEAIGLVCNYLYKHHPHTWKESISKLNDIDWSRSNIKAWQGRAFSSNGRINKNNSCIKLTAIKIKELISIKLTDEETKFEIDFKNNIEGDN